MKSDQALYIKATKSVVAITVMIFISKFSKVV